MKIPTGAALAAALFLTGCQGAVDFFSFPKEEPQPQITSFTVINVTPQVSASIDNATNTITFTVPAGTNVAALVAEVTYIGSAVTPGSLEEQDFSLPVLYTVEAKSGDTRAYTVTAQVAPPNGPTASGPTVEALQGVWINHSTYSYEQDGVAITEDETVTLTFVGDTFLNHREAVKTGSDGSTVFVYEEARGTYTIQGDRYTETTTARRAESAPFMDESGWFSLPISKVVERPLVLSSEGKLYGISSSNLLLKADGPHEGLLGNWAFHYVATGEYSSYGSYRYTIGASVIEGTMSYGSSADDPELVTQYGVFPYVDNGDGTFTQQAGDPEAPSSITQPFLVLGDYFLTGNSANLGAFERQ